MSTPNLAWSAEEKGGSWDPLEPWAASLAGVRINGDQLVFEFGNTSGRRAPELAHSSFKMLAEFARLSEGDCVADGRLLSFASRYSSLGLCKKHGWPLAHQRPHCPQDLSSIQHGLTQREPIDRWRTYSRFVRAIVTVLRGPRGAAHDAELEFLNQAGDSDARYAIVHWLAGGELRLNVLSRGSRPTLYGIPPLWTAIGLELAALAAGASGIILCSNCGRLDSVKRPRRIDDQRHAFCARCRDKGRKRLGAADLRQRQRRARALHAEHKSLKEIAAQLGIGTDSVRRYLKKEQDNG